MHKPRILLVDDEEELLKALAKSLEIYGYLVESCTGGHKAFDIYQKGSLDIIATDMVMPEGSGLELLKKVKAHNPHFPFLCFISDGEVSSHDRALKEGASGILTKPFRVKQLIQAVEKACLDPRPR